jgi:hypothetical protein
LLFILVLLLALEVFNFRYQNFPIVVKVSVELHNELPHLAYLCCLVLELFAELLIFESLLGQLPLLILELLLEGRQLRLELLLTFQVHLYFLSKPLKTFAEEGVSVIHRFALLLKRSKLYLLCL